MNKRDFLKFLPFSAAVVVLPAAANSFPTIEKRVTHPLCDPNPKPIDTFPSTTGYCIGTTPTATLSIHTYDHKRFETTVFERRDDGDYNLVFKLAK